MSNIILGGGPSGSGSVTLLAPNTNSNQTVNIPDRAGNLMMDGPAFSAYRFGAYQSFTQNTFTKVSIQQELFDTNNCYDSTTNYRFTPNVAGYYQVLGAVAVQNGSTYSRAIASIYKNGSEYTRSDVNQSSITFIAVQVSSLIYMNGTTDYLELYGYSNASAPNFDYGPPIACFFSASMVRAA
jgi:hypothetical protein